METEPRERVDRIPDKELPLPCAVAHCLEDATRRLTRYQIRIVGDVREEDTLAQIDLCRRHAAAMYTRVLPSAKEVKRLLTEQQRQLYPW